MKKTSLILSLAVAGCFVVGCDSKTETPAAPAAPAMPSTPTTPAAPTMGTPKAPEMPAGGMGAMKDAATGASEGAVKEVQDIIAKVQGYIKEGKLDDADALLKKAEAMKANLPEAVIKQLDSARSLLDTAKKGLGGMKMPEGMPGMPK